MELIRVDLFTGQKWVITKNEHGTTNIQLTNLKTGETILTHDTDYTDDGDRLTRHSFERYVSETQYNLRKMYNRLPKRKSEDL